MTVSVDDVRRLLATDVADAVLVLVQGRTDVIPAAQLESDEYRGALQIISRADLISRSHGAQMPEQQMEEEAARLDSVVANLGA